MSDEAEDEGGLSPVKDDNEVWRDLCRWESEISIEYSYYTSVFNLPQRRAACQCTRGKAKDLIAIIPKQS